LAEVLITLGIIGIVTALTMPTLISNHKKQEKITKIKKLYSVISQNIELSQAEHGDIESWNWDLSLTDFVETYLLKNLNITKNCKTSAGCWNKSGNIYGLNGTNCENIISNTYYKVQLTNGTYLALRKQDNNHIHFYVDINGERSPNKYGIDCFIMTFTNNEYKDNMNDITRAGLYMYGHGNTRNTLINLADYGCNKNQKGYFCGALFQQDNWQIHSDYDF